MGLRRVLNGGPAGTWGPRLVGAFGVGLMGAGVFVTDPGAGFPAGAPLGAPASFTWHAMLHEASFALAQVAWIASCIALSRRFASSRQRVGAALCLVAAGAAVASAAWPALDTLSMRLVLATAIEFGLVAGVAAHFLRRGVTQVAPVRRAAPSPNAVAAGHG